MSEEGTQESKNLFEFVESILVNYTEEFLSYTRKMYLKDKESIINYEKEQSSLPHNMKLSFYDALTRAVHKVGHASSQYEQDVSIEQSEDQYCCCGFFDNRIADKEPFITRETNRFPEEYEKNIKNIESLCEDYCRFYGVEWCCWLSNILQEASKIKGFSHSEFVDIFLEETAYLDSNDAPAPY
jgi:hypothetical protein